MAVVMYGGISLAVYMNGMARELFDLVVATAPDPNGPGMDTPDSELEGAQPVYRELGKIVGLRTLSREGLAALPNQPVRTRFIVDIVSGTSAGGLNGIFLAKALANKQDFYQLAGLWRQKASFSLLLNDSGSVGKSKKTDPGTKPASLLNSGRIYEELLSALKKMEEKRPDVSGCESPYVSQLDLYVTTTDVAGLQMPIRLSDKVVYERRYRNYYHFRYGYYGGANGVPYNDFDNKNTTFLAFACRCTSAFPFAFEPMNLQTASDLRQNGSFFPTLPARPEDSPSSDFSKAWGRFVPDYECAARAGRDDGLLFQNRYFIDGGCLDNKPFGYAIDALRWRQADVPVLRAFLYVEPDPVDPAAAGVSAEKPDAVGAVYAGYVDLPHVEAIRDDVQKLHDRNQLIHRFEQVIEQTERLAQPAEWLSASRAVHSVTSVTEEISKKGPAYAAYHRLKVSAVTDDIADIVAGAAGLDPDSDDVEAVRYLVRAWRESHYLDPHGFITNEFLVRFDLDYRIRRLSYLRRLLDKRFLHADESQRQVLSTTKSCLNRVRTSLLNTHAWLRTTDAAVDNPLREAILAFDADLSSRADTAPESGTPDTFAQIVKDVMLGDTTRLHLPDPSSEGDVLDGRRQAVAQHYVDKYGDELKGLSEVLARGLAHGELPPDPKDLRQPDHGKYLQLKEDKAGCRLEGRGVDGRPRYRVGLWEASSLVKEIAKWADNRIQELGGPPLHLLGSLERYEDVDAATFPILYASGVGEPHPARLVRFSPIDATRLLGTGTTRKLAGVSLGHFGAFVEEEWRQNDILWGRLDAVERIIDGLAPEVDEAVRASLIERAQKAILVQQVSDLQFGNGSNGLTGNAIYDMVHNGKKATPLPPSTSVPRTLTAERFVNASLEGALQTLGDLPAREQLQLGSRATRVVGRMLETISRARMTSPQAWMSVGARLGAVACGLVEAALPQSTWNLITRYWIRLFYFFALIMVVVGPFLDDRVQSFGLKLLGLTILVHLVVWWLYEWMVTNTSRNGVFRVVKAVVAALAVVVFVAGAFTVWSLVSGWVPRATAWLYSKPTGTATTQPAPPNSAPHRG